MSYDEYSHWGLMIKNIVAFDALPRRGAGAAFVLYDYPPMGALFPAMVCRIFGYRDGMAYFGYELLLLTLAAGFVPAGGHDGTKDGGLRACAALPDDAVPVFGAAAVFRADDRAALLRCACVPCSAGKRMGWNGLRIYALRWRWR